MPTVNHRLDPTTRHESLIPWRRALIGLLVASTVLLQAAVPARSQSEDRLFPFTLPWDDASAGPTDLSGWNQPIASEADRLHVRADGHFSRGRERVRLFGFDFASGAFPDRAFADRVAARLAKFGVNYVRIAQNSNPAAAGWIDPATQATLSAEALDRLDYLIAQLGRRGIYVHLVITHFRRVYPRTVPGFGGRQFPPEGWPRYGTGVDMFFPPVIDLNRALARELLTHKNAYTGLAYGQDPRIAIVEITNEDGLIQQWGAGGLDAIIAASSPHLVPLRDNLQARWNAWLQDRYADDTALRVAWDSGARAGGAELLSNGKFAAGAEGWRLDVHEGARAQWQIERGGGPQGLDALRVQVDQPGTEDWHVMVVQGGLSLREGQPYRVKFWAR
ncbi:MAG TPA: hypothetical protein VFV60_00120, partial [bacterium]|nr:hypothetical protein [bacterium]